MAPIVGLIEGQEWVIVAIVLVLFGGSRLPQLARSLGQAQKEFKKGLAEGDEDDEKPKDVETAAGPGPAELPPKGGDAPPA